MTAPTGDFLTDVVNLILERLDRIAETLDRIADALEASAT